MPSPATPEWDLHTLRTDTVRRQRQERQRATELGLTIAHTGTVGSTSHSPRVGAREQTLWWLRAAELPEWRPSPPTAIAASKLEHP